MPTLAALNNQATTDAAQEFRCVGASGLDLTISNNPVFLRFAYRQGGMTGAYGVEEYHVPKLLTIDSEAIDGVQYRSAVAGKAARLTIVATS